MKPDFTATKVWLPLYQDEESGVCHRAPIGLRFCRDLLPAASVFQRGPAAFITADCISRQLGSRCLTCCSSCSRWTRNLLAPESTKLTFAAGLSFSSDTEFHSSEVIFFLVT